jgi:hypothetical protein
MRLRVGLLTCRSRLSCTRHRSSGPPTRWSAARALKADGSAKILDRRYGFERTDHDLTGPGTLCLVGKPSLEQLGVGKDNAELVVEAMEYLRQISRGICGRLWRSGRGVRRHG